MTVEAHPVNAATNVAEPALYGELVQFFKSINAEKAIYKGKLSMQLQPIVPDRNLATMKLSNGFPLLNIERLAFDYTLMKEYAHQLLALVRERLPASAAEIIATALENEDSLKQLVQAALREEALEPIPGLLTFLITEAIHPVLEVYAAQAQDIIKDIFWAWGYCPMCGGDPLLSVLKTEKGGRYLVCSSCATEWRFPRIKCPSCENADHGTLSYFAVGDDIRYRIEVCEECKHYIKAVDLRAAGLVPSYMLEHIKTLHLDIIAQEKGYVGNSFLLNNTSDS